MYFPELFRIVLISENLTAELLTGQIKYMTIDIIIAVVISTGSEDAIYGSAKDILNQKGCDGALTEGFIRWCPAVT